MYRLLLLFTLPFLLHGDPFKVATYNVQNLFDAHYDGTEYKEYIPRKEGWNKQLAEVKLNHIAEVICDIDADIIGLQELENEAVFRTLQRKLLRVGCGYRYGAITHKRGAPIQVALLSRFPIQKKRELQVSYAPRVRNILEVTVRVEDYPLTLFVNHWKSKSRSGYESKRVAYAKRLVKRLKQLPPGVEYIIMGDLNTNYDAHVSLPQRLNDTGGRVGVNHLLHTVKNGTLLTETDMLAKPEKGHYDLWMELPYSQRWSHKYYGKKSSIDHILLPSAMFDGKGVDYVNDSFRVFKRNYLFGKRGFVNSWQVKAGRHTKHGYSDHLPLVATFDTKPYVPSENTHVQKSTKSTIDALYTVEKLTHPIILEDAVVVLKRGRYALIKQTPHGRGVFVYGTVEGLEEGKRYDLEVKELGTYQGLKEVTAMVKLVAKGNVELDPYYKSLSIMRQNEVVRQLKGVYKNRYFYTDGEKIPIYFKKGVHMPPNGAKLNIAYAHLGYYKRLQLVIYSQKDFTILEK